jgi:hypothetical protein
MFEPKTNASLEEVEIEDDEEGVNLFNQEEPFNSLQGFPSI